VAILCSIALFTALAWILPAVNVTFQREIFGSILTKGLNELTLGELRDEIDSYRRSGLWDTHLLVSYHVRWALSCATLVLALFALSVTQRLVARWAITLAAFGACFSYYLLLWLGRAAALQDTLPAFVGAWLPNLAFAVVSIALLRVASPRSSLEPEA
jgi:lipopolysaccharide export LptBFGC system permease protein LptF